MACGQPLTDDVALADRDRTDPSIPVIGALRAQVDVDQRRDSSDVDLVVCPSCEATNTAQRARCARCGSVLRSDRLPPSPVLDDDGWRGPVPAMPDADGAGGTRRGRGLAVAIVVLGVLVGTTLGLAAGLGVGPFATVEPVPFDPAAYPGEPARLQVATAGSSSTAGPEGARTFGPERTADGDLTTAWVAGDDGDERVLLRHGFVQPVWVDRIEVATGDQFDETAFAERARVVRAEIDLGTIQVDATIAGIDGVQILQLDEPVLTDEVTWRITETTGGAAAISEVRYIGWQADEADRDRYRQA